MTQYTQELIEKAKQIATKAHKGQKRWGGEDYIIHPEAVANSLERPEQKIVAWLHDVLEDTKLTMNDLLAMGIPANLVEAVKKLKMDIKMTIFRVICWTLLKLHLVTEKDVFWARFDVEAERAGLKIKRI